MIYSIGSDHVSVPGEGKYWIAPNAAVMGKVKLEENVGVWFSATIRGEPETITIREGSNIQDNCIMHTDPGYPLTVERHCTIGHNVILHGCHVGERCLIGMGSIILNGAKIGKESLIGANTLIAENKEIPPRSLVVGSPGKVIRQLSDEDVEQLEISAQSYIKKWQRFAVELTASS